MSVIEHIRQSIGQEVFDYTQLMHTLSNYNKPRDVVTSLLKKNQILRVRKGLYVFNQNWQRKRVSREMLANLIYGPSMISLDYALSWYGLIPEKVTTITSVTPGRSRKYNTPLGAFTYKHIDESKYSFGASLQKSDAGNWLITEPLKALADKVWTDKRFHPSSLASFKIYLFDDLRIDESSLEKYYDEGFLEELNKNYKSRKVRWLTEYLLKLFNTPGE